MIEKTEQVVLDVKDKKILFELSLNARASLSEIAKKVGLSKQVVRYRMESLEEKKVIEGYYALLNIGKLGYSYYRVMFKFQNVDLEREQEITEYCKKNRKIGWIVSLEGNWDMAAVIWAKTVPEFEEELDRFLNKFGNFIDEYAIAVSTKIYHLKHKFLLNKHDFTELLLGGKIENNELDDVDRKIIGLLCKNARKSLLDMGFELKINPKVVQYRIKKLIEKGIIIGFNVKLNHRLLGYTQHKVFLNLKKISDENLAKLRDYIKSLKSAIYITKAVGMADLEFETMTKSNEEFHEVLRDLRFKFSDLIKNYYSIIFFHEPYINYLPMEK